jgi:hypothetical protein
LGAAPAKTGKANERAIADERFHQGRRQLRQAEEPDGEPDKAGADKGRQSRRQPIPSERPLRFSHLSVEFSEGGGVQH